MQIPEPLGPASTKAIRQRLAGTAELRAALAAGRSVQVVLLVRGASKDAQDTVDEAKSRGARVLPTTANELRRLANAQEPVELLAMIGADPAVPLTEALLRRGPAWLLAGLQFPGNIGFALRTLEVSGACAVAVAPAVDGAVRRAALRASMRADRFMPVAWTTTEDVLSAARSTGRRVVAIEDDERAVSPWDADLTGNLLFVAGGERDGLGSELLRAADAVLRLPMAGVIPAYNVHAAIAAVAAERMRQEACVRPK